MSNRKRGVYDPGAAAGGETEAAVVLQFAKAIEFIAKKQFPQIRILLTRQDEKEPAPVGTRARKAKQEGAKVLVSLHLNASVNPLARGTEIFFRDAADKRLADVLCPRIASAVGTRNRGPKDETLSQHNRLAVLTFDGPAVLIELGFITNPADRRSLLRRETRIAVAEVLLNTLKEIYL